LIHRKEMCRFGLSSGRTRQAYMIFVSCEWSGLKHTSSGHFDLCTSRIQLLHVLLHVHSPICITCNQIHCSVRYKNGALSCRAIERNTTPRKHCWPRSTMFSQGIISVYRTPWRAPFFIKSHFLLAYFGILYHDVMYISWPAGRLVTMLEGSVRGFDPGLRIYKIVNKKEGLSDVTKHRGPL
jgi:hypothetical protein